MLNQVITAIQMLKRHTQIKFLLIVILRIASLSTVCSLEILKIPFHENILTYDHLKVRISLSCQQICSDYSKGGIIIGIQACKYLIRCKII